TYGRSSVGPLISSVSIASYSRFAPRRACSSYDTSSGTMSIPTAPSCRFTSSASRSYGASGGTRQVNRNRVPESSDAAAAGSNLKVAASRGIAQLRGQIGPVDATPYEFSAFLTTASLWTARFNARRIAADLSCGASGFKTMTYWYRRVNVNNEIEFAFSREGRAS